VMATRLALRSREASSRELSMGFEAICLQDGRFSRRRFSRSSDGPAGSRDEQKIDVFSVLSVFSVCHLAGP
jgi:hypothetical protein